MSINKFVSQTWPSILAAGYKENETASSHIYPRVEIKRLSQKEIVEAEQGRSVAAGTSPPQQSINGPPTRGTKITRVSRERRRCLTSWYDWKCNRCKNRNPGNWFTCNQPECPGEATDRQLPEGSWQCKTFCGQNNWSFDHYCNACERPNPTINPNELKRRPLGLVGRPRELQQWFGRPPTIDP